MKNKKDVPGLIRALKNQNVKTRQKAILAQGPLGDAINYITIVYAATHFLNEKYTAKLVRKDQMSGVSTILDYVCA